MRPDEPEHLKQWKEDKPKCCHTCIFFDAVGRCLEVHEQPPLDYVLNGSKDCDRYEIDDIPF